MSQLHKLELDGLLSNRLVTNPEYEALLRAANPAFSPQNWVSNAVAALGVTLILSGIICFFAANWKEMGTLLRLGLPLLGLLACGAGAFYKGLESRAGQVCALAAALFIGVFMAVYGQTFQTGAFVYELFLSWAICLLPLALLARNKWMWLLWAYVILLYTGSYYEASFRAPFWQVGGVLLFFWVASEAAYFKKYTGRAFAFFFFLPLLAWVTGYGLEWNSSQFYTAFALALASGAYGFWLRKNILMLGAAVFALDALLAFSLLQIGKWGQYWAILGLVLLVLYVASAFGTYKLYRRMKGDSYGA